MRFKQEASSIEDATFLAQGTLYPDVIESGAAPDGPAATIKLHHNVGGLPEELGFELIEPLRDLFKDEVRQIGSGIGTSRTPGMATSVSRTWIGCALSWRGHASAAGNFAGSGFHPHRGNPPRGLVSKNRAGIRGTVARPECWCDGGRTDLRKCHRHSQRGFPGFHDCRLEPFAVRRPWPTFRRASSTKWLG